MVLGLYVVSMFTVIITTAQPTYTTTHVNIHSLFAIPIASPVDLPDTIAVDWPMTSPTPHNPVCLTVNIRTPPRVSKPLAGAIRETYVSYIFFKVKVKFGWAALRG